MERKRSRGVRRISTVPFDSYFSLGYVKQIIAPHGLEIIQAGFKPRAEDKNRRKATVKIRRNPLLRFLSVIQTLF